MTTRHFLTRCLIASALGVPLLWFAWNAAGQRPDADRAARQTGEAAVDDHADRERDGEPWVGRVRPVPVAVTTLEATSPPDLVRHFHGVVRARRVASLGAKSLARIEQVQVDVGDQVEPDQVLVELDRRQLEATRRLAVAERDGAAALLAELTAGPRPQELAIAEERVREATANLALREATHERLSRLTRGESVSRQEIDEARAALDAAGPNLAAARQTLEQLREGTRREQLDAQRSRLEAAEARIAELDIALDETRIRAPFAGRVQQRWLDEGTVVSPGQAILELVEDGQLELQVGLPPELIVSLQDDHGDGQDPWTTRLAARIGGRRVAVSHPRLAPAVDDATRTRLAMFALPEDLRDVSPGDAATLEVPEIGTDEDGGWWVPTRALSSATRGLWSLFVVRDAAEGQVAERCDVELLRSHGDWSRVRGPLEAGDRLVLAGAHKLAAGQRVRATSPSDASQSQSANESESIPAKPSPEPTR